MPHALVALPDVYDSVIRRIVQSATEQLNTIMRLPSDTRIYIPGRSEAIPLNGGIFTQPYDPGVYYPNSTKMIVSFSEDPTDDYTIQSLNHMKESFPIILDETRDIRIHPVHRMYSMTMTIEYHSDSKATSQKWLDEMRTRIMKGRSEFYLNLEYYYALPTNLLNLLMHVHEKMESSAAPTGLTFEDWLDNQLMIPIKHVANQIQEHKTITFPERQSEVLGWFDFESSPETPEAEEAGMYQTSIGFTFHYQRPMQLFVDYPFLIHNKPIAKKYRDRKTMMTFREEFIRRVSRTKGALDDMLAYMVNNRIPYVQYPENDDWVPNETEEPNRTLILYTGLVMVDPDDPRQIMNLSNLGDMQFTSKFLEYFSHAGNELFVHHGTPFDFRLYENRKRKYIDLELVNGTEVRSLEDLDITKYYHIQIGIKRCWTMLDRKNREALRRYPQVLYWLLRALNVWIGTNMTNAGNYISRVDDPATKWTYEDFKQTLLGQGQPRSADPKWLGEGYETNNDLDGLVRKKDFDHALDALARKECMLDPQNEPAFLNVLFLEILAAKQ